MNFLAGQSIVHLMLLLDYRECVSEYYGNMLNKKISEATSMNFLWPYAL